MTQFFRQVLIGFAIIVPSMSLAQSTQEPAWQQAAGHHRQFEVASFKPALPDAPRIDNVDLVAADSFRYHGGLVRMQGLLISYVIFAFKLTDESQYQAIYKQLGKPFESQDFAVEARPPEVRKGGQPSTDELRLMVQSLLADRVKLALHSEIRRGSVYQLTLVQPGKPGPRLVPHPDDGLCTPPPAIALEKPPAPPYCALLLTNLPDHTTEARVLGFSLDQIAGTLATLASTRAGMDALPVIDRTGLSGHFDLRVTFRPIANRPLPDGEPDAPAAAFAEALRRDAGLKLTKAPGPVATVVIDHVEAPSAN